MKALYAARISFYTSGTTISRIRNFTPSALIQRGTYTLDKSPPNIDFADNARTAAPGEPGLRYYDDIYFP